MRQADELVNVAIDADICVGVGACVAAEPGTFEPTDEGTSAVRPDARLPRERAELVCGGCPTGAIAIEEPA
jgi:ferredoxin